MKNGEARISGGETDMVDAYFEDPNEITINKMKSNAFDQIEIHSSFIEDGISTMRKIDNLRISETSFRNIKLNRPIDRISAG